MEKISILEKVDLLSIIGKKLSFLLLSILIISCSTKDEPLKVAISPYQDIAMIVNIKNLNLEEKYNIQVDLLTMNWEDILPAISSAGKTADIGYGSLTEYLTKVNNLNKNSKDPVLFIYPAYIFKGGGFITFNNEILPFDSENILQQEFVDSFLSKKIGAQKNSIYEMMLYSLAIKNKIDLTRLTIYDTPLNDGILAIQNGSLDITAAGLTQITEAKKNSGTVVLTMDDLGFADITGFICKKSVFIEKKEEISSIIKMWFECVDFVFSNLDKNSIHSLDYLNKMASTQYTFDQYKQALSQEYFPRSIAESNSVILSDEGTFSYRRISEEIIEYLVVNNIVDQKPSIPNFINIK